MRINWTHVSGNSSSIDAVASFARGMPLNRAAKLAWDPETKKIFSQLRKLPTKQARARARGWCKRNLATWWV